MLGRGGIEGEVVVIYHADCYDGFGGALAAYQYLGSEGVVYYPGVYKTPPPNVRGRYVFLIDFTYPPDVVRDMLLTCKGIVILDHHITAIDAFSKFTPSNKRIDVSDTNFNIDTYIEKLVSSDNTSGSVVYTYFDNNRSGAVISWEFFNKDSPPELIYHIQDRDLWHYKLPMTNEILAVLGSYDYDFEKWNSLARASKEELIKEGIPIHRKQLKDISDVIRLCRRKAYIGWHYIPIASSPYHLASDVAGTMACGEPFAAAYYDTDTYRVFSLRSNTSGVDVSRIALGYGGGGHRAAAGFRVPRDHYLAKI